MALFSDSQVAVVQDPNLASGGYRFAESTPLFSLTALLKHLQSELKRAAKTLVLRYYPSFYHRRVARRLRNFFREQYFPFQTEIRNRLFGEHGEIQVLAGPFRGTKYFNEVFYSSATPRWLGTYEMELHPVVEEIGRSNYRSIIDVGSAEGYYAVGLARMCPQAQIYAFDADPWSRDQCRRLSKLNNVSDRLRVGGLLASQDIARLAVSPALLVCDIEGYEMSLLDPQTCAALKHCDVLVEVHELAEFGNQVEQMLRRRFVGTHCIQAISTSPRPVAAVQALFPADTSAEDIQSAMAEHRSGEQRWLWMKQCPII